MYQKSQTPVQGLAIGPGQSGSGKVSQKQGASQEIKSRYFTKALGKREMGRQTNGKTLWTFRGFKRAVLSPIQGGVKEADTKHTPQQETDTGKPFQKTGWEKGQKYTEARQGMTCH
jgi:hypothetical protein